MSSLQTTHNPGLKEKPKVDKWEHEDNVVLYAWIDFCKWHNSSFVDDITMLLELNKKFSGREYSFTVCQIKQKIIDRNRYKWKLQPYPILATILKEGSKADTWLTEPLRKEVANQLQIFKDRHTRWERQDKDRQLGEDTIDGEGDNEYIRFLAGFGDEAQNVC
jgi:hypothetical protein